MKNKTTVLIVLFAFSLLTTAILTVQVASIPTINASENDASNVVEAAPEVEEIVLEDLEEPDEAGAWSNPIILIHGYIAGYGLTPWYKIRNRLIASGCPSNKIFEIRYSNVVGSNVNNAYQLRDYVNYVLRVTGASKVDLICHSMGGLSARYYIRFLGGRYKVDDYVSLGTPQKGTVVAIIGLWTAGGREMIPGSSFLNSLNSGDETPGYVHYVAIYAYWDELVQPYWNAKLYDGATNKGKYWVGHIGLLFDYTVYTWTRDAVKY
jgi:triacylglycerol lipase